ncbi:MAG: asparagine--tRNA ligase, partial [Cyanobacteria bacterium REEB65]|nr:asparagine--tRNA ligase [Cyanobacteria bacterium REEB65]
MSQAAAIVTTTVSMLCEHVGQTVRLRGWVYDRTAKGKLQFLKLRDGTGIVQAVVFRPAVPESSWDAAERLSQESSCVVEGEVKAEPRAPGGYEVAVSSVEVRQIAQEYPITPKEHGIDFLMGQRHLWLRSKRQHAILKIRS